MKDKVSEILNAACFLFGFFMRQINCGRAILIFAALLFFGTLFWAKWQDPFIRKRFTLKTEDFGFCDCVAVLAKPLNRYPVVIYIHGWGGTIMTDGNDLRHMAEFGLATFSLEYNQSNEIAFASQFESLLHFIGRQRWANTNAIAWVGSSLGANRLLDFALQHPKQQPQLLIQLSGAGLNQLNSRLLTNLHCPVLLIHGDQDNTFPIEDTKRLASALQSDGLPVDLKILSGAPHNMGPDRGIIFRCIGEYSLTHLLGANSWENYHSITQWKAKAPPFWFFLAPAVTSLIGWFICSYQRRVVSSAKRLKCDRIIIRWGATALIIFALFETAIHLVMPCLFVNYKTLAIARHFLVRSKDRADFEFLATEPIWRDQELKTLLEHVELANYNRGLIDWGLDENIYRYYVLSPTIAGNANEQLSWRRSLWEEFYPRIRHENSLVDAADIVVRHLRERITLAPLLNPPRDISDIWLRQITDEDGYEIILVAALRSVGIPSRLNSKQKAEFWDGKMWQVAPRPSATSWLSQERN